jgi:hypothetical protein
MYHQPDPRLEDDVAYFGDLDVDDELWDDEDEDD